MDLPVEPQASDCCNSGCNPCILDVYNLQLKKYNERQLIEPPNRINAINETSLTMFNLISRFEATSSHLRLCFGYNDHKKPKPDWFHFKPGQYVMIKASDRDGSFTRAYTPISSAKSVDLQFEIIVKLYPNGRMAELLRFADLGTSYEVRGPYGDFTPVFTYKFLVFVVQGVGIAPVFTILRDLLPNDDCNCFIKLFYACRSSTEILFRQELYDFCSYWNFKHEIYVCSINSNFTRKYNEIVFEKRLKIDYLLEYLNEKQGIQVLICGSPDFSAYFSENLNRLNEVDLFVF